MIVLQENSESRPSIYWFHNEETNMDSSIFFWGQINEKREFLESLGFEVKV